MNQFKLAIVGGGQMARAIVGGMLAKGVLKTEQIHIVDPSAESQSWWKDNQPAAQVDNNFADAVAKADIVLLAVKPNIIPSVIDQPSDVWKSKLVVSIAAGISLDQLASGIGHSRVVRVMPNTPSLVGEGASAYCGGNQVTDEDFATIETMLSSIGLAVRIGEAQMPAVTGLSGSGPAYICLVVEALADGGVLTGLPRPLAMKLAAQTVLGTAKLIAETGKHPGELKDAVASPGGTTIEALKVLEENGLRAALINAVKASAEKSKVLSP